MRINQGWVRNSETGKKADIIVDQSPLTPKQAIVGLLIIGLGLKFMTRRAFANGVQAMEDAEYRALDEAGIFKN